MILHVKVLSKHVQNAQSVIQVEVILGTWEDEDLDMLRSRHVKGPEWVRGAWLAGGKSRDRYLMGRTENGEGIIIQCAV